MNSPTLGPTPQELGALVGLVGEDRLSEAESRARQLLSRYPNHGMVWKVLGVALVRQDKDAIAALRRTTELMPDDSEAHRNLARAWQERGEWAQALQSLHRALELQPLDADGFSEAADAMRALGRVAEAVPLYERALLLDPQLLEARNNLGNAFLELRRHWDAARCYRLAAEARPDDPVILCNLGNAQRVLGLWDEANISLQRAIALEPRMSLAHHYLGLVLVDLGQPEAAVESLQRALAMNPNDTVSLNSLGHVLRDLGRRREAAQAFERAIAVDPSRAESHDNLGTLLFDRRRVDAAIESFRRALAWQPGYAPAHLHLGLAQRQLRRFVDAEASCCAALAIDPEYTEALAFLGELHADRGEFAQAEQLFKRAIAIDPDFAGAYSSIATHRKMTVDDTDWLRGAEARLAKRLPLAQEIGLHYALGKYFDDVRRYDQAFDHYRLANDKARLQGAGHDRAKLERRVDGLIERFDAAFVRKDRADASGSQIPIFIIGMPRSGTSLAEQILASHPAVFGAGEVIFWNAAYDAFDERTMGRVAADYLDHVTSLSAGAGRVVDKMPANFFYAGLIHAAFPNARIIHMQRHPVDTCLSLYFQNFFNIGPYAHDLEDLAHYYGEYVRITDHWRAVLPPPVLLEVAYEALIEDQEGWIRRMVEFVGLPWDPKCLDFHLTNRVVITASKWQVRQRIHGASTGRWRNYEKYAGPLMKLVRP